MLETININCLRILKQRIIRLHSHFYKIKVQLIRNNKKNYLYSPFLQHPIIDALKRPLRFRHHPEPALLR